MGAGSSSDNILSPKPEILVGTMYIIEAPIEYCAASPVDCTTVVMLPDGTV
jgi:hypothetical protein